MAPLGPTSPGAEKKSSAKSPETLGHVVLGEKKHVQIQSTMHGPIVTSTRGLVAMTSASHAEGRQFDPGQVYFFTNPHSSQIRLKSYQSHS